MKRSKKLTKSNTQIKKRLKENPTVNVDEFTALIKESTKHKPFNKKK